jgi:hypothetical protein
MPSRALLSALFALVLVPSLASAQESPTSQADPAGQTEKKDATKIGFYGTLLGPNSQLGFGVGVQPSPLLEASLWYGHNGASVTESTFTAKASATIKLNTIMARARLWMQPRHSLVIDLGAGLSVYDVSATGSNIVGDSLSYSAKGTPPVATIGLAYGFRTEGGFRLTVGGGALIHAGKIGDSTVTSTGSFSATDRESLRTSIDSELSVLSKPRAYLDLSLGAFF